ncbi:MAG: integrase family protein [Geobacteraceae bacterium]|nr:integrase family protein [Geobacteraceae bacterium]
MAEKIKLTKTIVDKIPFAEKGKQVEYYDAELPAFGVRVSATSKVYFVRKWINGKLSRVTLGRHDVMSADKARKEAGNATTDLRKGIDINLEKTKAKARSITLGKVFEQFLKTRNGLKPKTVAMYSDHVDRLLSSWKNKPIAEITSDMVAKRHSDISKVNGKATANSAMRTFRAIYNFARSVTENTIPENPAHRLSQTKQWNKIERRRTFIKPHFMQSWYNAVNELNNPVVSCHLLLLVYTGLRKNESLQLKWTEVDMKDKSFTITDPKNSLPHTLPMSKFIYTLFEKLQQHKVNEYVFPGATEGSHLKDPRRNFVHVTDLTCLALNNVSTAEELEAKRLTHPDSVMPGIKFTQHDLRRTFITVAESLDISYAALKRLLNHSDGSDVTGGYLQITTDRLRDPMERISKRLLELMTSNPVDELAQ